MSIESVLALLRPEIRALEAYSSARSETALGGDSWLWLDANENPWAPFPGEPTTTGYNRYPDPQPPILMERIAAYYGVKPTQVMVTRGGDEGIDIIVRSFCRAGQDAIVITPPTFGFYKVAADIQGAKVISVPLDAAKGFALDTQALLAAVDSRVKIVFLCSPNNPTGNLLPREQMLEIARLLMGKSLVVVDEAYVDFAGVESLASEVETVPNLIIIRTFSKAASLAGVRAGTTIAHPELIKTFRKVLAPYPIPVPVLKAILDALSPIGVAVARERVARLVAERERMEKALLQSPDVVKIFPSSANYFLVAFKSSSEILKRCKENGIILRDRSSVYPQAIRISLGSPEQNDLLLSVLGVKPDNSARSPREATVSRKTNETAIQVYVNLDREGQSHFETGIGFFDHMLEQIARHGGFSLQLQCKGDLQVDAHHSIEDCGLALGQALRQALGDKRGILRYGSTTPMDESLSEVAIDLSGRPSFQFNGVFPVSHVGEFPAEMTYHFFKSISDTLGASIHIQVKGENTHHMIEACFKGFGRALRQAIHKAGDALPSTKGVL